MNHLWHLMDDGRIEMAMSYLRQEYRKMLPSMPSGARADMEEAMWRWTNSEWPGNPRTFWNHFCAVQMAAKPSSDLWKYASAKNVAWTERMVPTSEIAFSRGEDPAPPGDEPVILLELPSGRYRVLDGTRRLRNEVGEQASAHVGVVSGGKPMDYWVPTSWMIQLRDHGAVEALCLVTKDSRMALKELNDKVLAGHDGKTEVLRVLKKMRLGH